MADISTLAINTISNKPLNLRQAAELYAAKGVPAFTPWYDGVDEFGVSATKALVDDLGIDFNGFCLCGLISNEGPAKRQQAIDENRRRLDVAAELGISFVVTVAGGLLPESRNLAEASSYAFDSLAEILEHARSVNVTLALEALHPMYCPDWSVVTTLKQANDWCDQLGDGTGVVVDTYHVWWDTTLAQEIERAGNANCLVAYHVSDWLVPTSDLLLDRGLMGDGVIDIPGITRLMREAGFQGRIEVEIFSNTWWTSDQSGFVDSIMERFVNAV
jgi:sugar phosphate isomerase/epimerase